jgi:septum formation inhibitor MinC
MNISKDLNSQTFENVIITNPLPTKLEEIYDHFQAAIKQAQKHFLSKRRDVDVQAINGNVLKCGVELCVNSNEYVNVWPTRDGKMREGISVNRGTLSVLLTALSFFSTIY